MSISKPQLFRLAPSLTLPCLLTIFCSPAMADDPPIVLPPITVTAVWHGGSETLCTGMNCSSILGSTVSQAIYQEVNAQIGQADIFFDIPIQDIPDNPNNSETGVTCASDEEIRLSHAVQDIGPQLSSLDVLDGVRIHYESGQSELGVIQCIICGVPVVQIPSTCG